MHNAKTMELDDSAKVVLQHELATGKLEKVVLDLKNHPDKIKELEH